MAVELASHEAPAPIEFDEFCARLSEQGVDLNQEEGITKAVTLLARLYANRAFLSEIALAELKNGCMEQAKMNAYGAQVLMLNRLPGSHFIRANFWPAADDIVLKASGAGHFAYYLPHDHNFDFLTLGYVGPGYRSRWYEYDYAKVAGYSDEQVELVAIEEGALTPGRMLHYRAHRDVHDQHPPEALSVSINIIPENANAMWLDQYHFDLERSRLSQLSTISQNEIALRIATALSEDGLDLAHDFARNHPSERVRWQAWSAVLGGNYSEIERIALIETAATDSSSLVRGEARTLLACLTSKMEASIATE